MPVPPGRSAEGAGSSARGRLGAVAVGCEASNAAASAPAWAAGGGRARLWAVRKLVEGGGRWSWRWRLAVAGDQPSEQAVDVGAPPAGVGYLICLAAAWGDVRDSGGVADTWDGGFGRSRGPGCGGGGWVGGRLPPRPTGPGVP